MGCGLHLGCSTRGVSFLLRWRTPPGGGAIGAGCQLMSITRELKKRKTFFLLLRYSNLELRLSKEKKQKLKNKIKATRSSHNRFFLVVLAVVVVVVVVPPLLFYFFFTIDSNSSSSGPPS